MLLVIYQGLLNELLLLRLLGNALAGVVQVGVGDNSFEEPAVVGLGGLEHCEFVSQCRHVLINAWLVHTSPTLYTDIAWFLLFIEFVNDGSIGGLVKGLALL